MNAAARSAKVRGAITQNIGHYGRMLHGGKVAPKGQEVYWNACIFTEDGEQCWYGDFNVTTESEKLQKVADKIGETITLTPEQPFRFTGLKGEKHGIRQIEDRDRERVRVFAPSTEAQGDTDAD